MKNEIETSREPIVQQTVVPIVAVNDTVLNTNKTANFQPQVAPMNSTNPYSNCYINNQMAGMGMGMNLNQNPMMNQPM